MNSFRPLKAASFPLIISTLLLSACGGGSDEPPPAPAPSQPTNPQPVTSVPLPTYTDAYRLDAFNRINEVRRLTGLGLLAQSTQLDTAAVNHANYVVINHAYGHTETYGMPGFTGQDLVSRLPAAGYVAMYSQEVLAGNLALTGAKTVDSLMSGVYHRLPFLDYQFVDVGMGRAAYPDTPNSGAFLMEFAYRNSPGPQGAPAVPYVIWPLNGSTIDRLTLDPESPSPPGQGYPVSINVDSILGVQKFELREAGSSTLVPAFVLTSATDANLKTPYFMALSPRDPLKPHTTYNVTFEGTYGFVERKPLSVNWSFSTP